MNGRQGRGMFDYVRAQSTISAHRGPFQLCGLKTGKKGGFYTTSWIQGHTDKSQALDEALAILQDPRDTWVSISLWSLTESCHVYTIRKVDV